MVLNQENKNDILPNDTLDILNNLIQYQNEKLIRHIAKAKGWNEKELLQEFLLKSNNLDTCKNHEKKKSIQLNMENIDGPDNDSINSLIFDQYNNNSPVLSHSSSCDSLDSSTPKKKRGRPKKLSSSDIKLDNSTPKKKRGRPKKIKEIEPEKNAQPKRKRGRPKKNVEKEIFNDPNIDLQEQLEDDQDSIEVLNNYDKQLYEEKQ